MDVILRLFAAALVVVFVLTPTIAALQRRRRVSARQWKVLRALEDARREAEARECETAYVARQWKDRTQ